MRAVFHWSDARPGELLGTSSRVDGVAGLLLEFGWTRMHDELVSGIECGGDGVSRQGGEVGVVYRFGADLFYANADRFARRSARPH